MKYERYPTRNATRNYFPMPNEIFSLGLSTGEIATYAYLMRCENRETYQCYPAMATIGEAIGKQKNSVMKYVRGLEEKHLIYTEPTTVWGKDGKKRNGNLRFTIRPIGCEKVSCEAADAGKREKTVEGKGGMIP